MIAEEQEYRDKIVNGIGYPGKVADLRCGKNEFAQTFFTKDIGYFEYYGFDSDLESIQIAKQGDYPNAEFQIVDIFRYSSDRKYDTCLMIDIAQYQENPVESIIKLLNLWGSKKYVVNFLIGEQRNVLEKGGVRIINFGEFSQFVDYLFFRRFKYNIYMEKYDDQCYWVMVDVNE